jgi:hypothetical protein
MNPRMFLLGNVALAFYLTGAVWAHEVDIFRTWQMVDAKDFRRVQASHWRRLPFWIFLPLGCAFAGSILLIWFRPLNSPVWAIWGSLSLQAASHVLTALFWGKWQAQLSKDDRGPASPYLHRILTTHWVRTLLISAYALTLLAWAMRTLV